MWQRGLCVVILWAVASLASVEIRAQENETSANPIKWAVKAVSIDAARINIELTAEIERGWHLYSTERVEGGPSPTRITVAPNQGFEIAGEIDSPAPHSAYDPNFQVATESYEGSVTFKIPLKSATARPGRRLRVQVRYQSCTATICLPPQLLELETVVNGPEAKSVPKDQPETSAGISLAVGAVVPDFEFIDFEGKRHTLAEFRGRAVLLDFWASWCSPCLADIPELKKVYQKFHAQGFEIIGLNSEAIGQKDVEAEFVKSGEGKAREIVATRSVNWPQSVNATSLPIASRFGVESLPAKFLIDGEGRVVARISKVSELEAVLGSLLGSKP
ncbi:MAG TPA: protein-disulfide reductase DsbD domain-containing protein [Pyrinomonadaceae bacterium]|nr:protein-disulfide reductase DsbD domain-containing protein [Pyrinomonadaceae bacterium]